MGIFWLCFGNLNKNNIVKLLWALQILWKSQIPHAHWDQSFWAKKDESNRSFFPLIEWVFTQTAKEHFKNILSDFVGGFAFWQQKHLPCVKWQQFGYFLSMNSHFILTWNVDILLPELQIVNTSNRMTPVSKSFLQQ